MKKLIFAAILSTLASAAQAGDSDNFRYGGFSLGVNSYTSTANNINRAARPNGSATLGTAWRLTDAQAVGGELQLIGINTHSVAHVQGVYFTPIGDQTPAMLVLHSGYGARMGATTGADVVLPIGATNTSLRLGCTLFQNKVEGARGMLNIGLFSSF